MRCPSMFRLKLMLLSKSHKNWSKSHKGWLTDIPFAHRGWHGPLTGHMENSLSAFRAANARGHGFELDILLSKDNRAMVFHDLNLERLTGQTGRIDDFTARELSQLRLGGTDEPVPALRRVLSEADPKLPILIEIKGDQKKYGQIAQAVYNDIKHYDGPAAIMSFYPDILAWFLTNAPHITKGLVATSINDGELPLAYFSPDRQCRIMDRLAVDFIAYDINALPNEVSDYARAGKKPVLTWTVRSPQLYRKARAYADNIIYENLDP